jgi:hypothetical protein
MVWFSQILWEIVVNSVTFWTAHFHEAAFRVDHFFGVHHRTCVAANFAHEFGAKENLKGGKSFRVDQSFLQQNDIML